ncbi:MAG: hypothetical protein JNN05_08480 [Candidatus Omnitrophica bacterium]|nr:hypothetical protein [Candidatus Omnitrophota bacterium]
MQLSKWVKLMAFITVLSLGYIHVQMKIYQLAYRAKQKEHQIQKLKDENGVNTYHILSLKSISHMGEKMLAQDSPMEFISNDKVFEVASVQSAPTASVNKNVNHTAGKLTFNLNNWLTVSTPQAEAKQLDQ